VPETLSAESSNSLTTNGVIVTQDARAETKEQEQQQQQQQQQQQPVVIARSDSSLAGDSDKQQKATPQLPREQTKHAASTSPPLPTMLSSENANSASSSVASSLDGPHPGRHHMSSSTIVNEKDVGYHLLDVCERLTRDMALFMHRRSHALNVRRVERNAVLGALQDTLSGIWPGQCSVDLYGSCATQLDLPSSDLDVVVFGLDQQSHQLANMPSASHSNDSVSSLANDNGDNVQQDAVSVDSRSIQQHQSEQLTPHTLGTPQRYMSPMIYRELTMNGERVMRLAQELERQPWAVHIKPIPTATVPVVKVLADPTRIPTNVANPEWIMQQQYRQQQTIGGQTHTGGDHVEVPGPHQHPLPFHSSQGPSVWRGTDVDNGLLKLDITFQGPEHGGIGSTEFSKNAVQEFCDEAGLPPEGTPVVQALMVLKELLAQRHLNEPFSGGLSSYALLVLVLSVLRERTVIREELDKVEEQRRMVAEGVGTTNSLAASNSNGAGTATLPQNNSPATSTQQITSTLRADTAPFSHTKMLEHKQQQQQQQPQTEQQQQKQSRSEQKTQPPTDDSRPARKPPTVPATNKAEAKPTAAQSRPQTSLKAAVKATEEQNKSGRKAAPPGVQKPNRNGTDKPKSTSTSTSTSKTASSWASIAMVKSPAAPSDNAAPKKQGKVKAASVASSSGSQHGDKPSKSTPKKASTFADAVAKGTFASKAAAQPKKKPQTSEHTPQSAHGVTATPHQAKTERKPRSIAAAANGTQATTSEKSAPPLLPSSSSTGTSQPPMARATAADATNGKPKNDLPPSSNRQRSQVSAGDAGADATATQASSAAAEKQTKEEETGNDRQQAKQPQLKPRLQRPPLPTQPQQAAAFDASLVSNGPAFPQGFHDVIELLCSGELTSGKLFMHFLLFYGQHFDSQATAIDYSGTHERDYSGNKAHSALSPYIQRRTAGSFDPMTGMLTVDPIVVYDPLPGAEHNNVARSCFAWSSIRWVFAQSYMTLSNAAEMSGTSTSPPPSSSSSSMSSAAMMSRSPSTQVSPGPPSVPSMRPSSSQGDLGGNAHSEKRKLPDNNPKQQQQQQTRGQQYQGTSKGRTSAMPTWNGPYSKDEPGNNPLGDANSPILERLLSF